MPVKSVPATRFPMVTGSRFQKSHWPTEMGAPSIMPDGIRNMLTTECSKPSAKKVMIGSHMAAIFPTVDLETKASTAPIVTIQLRSEERRVGKDRRYRGDWYSVMQTTT